MKQIFWSDEENRLKMLWRLAAAGLIGGILLVALTTAASLPAFGAIVASSGIPLEELITSLQENPETASQYPILLAANALGAAVAVALAIPLLGRFIDRRKLPDYGLHLDSGWWLDLGFGLALGAVLMALIFVLELALGWVTITGTAVGTDQLGFGAGFLGALVVFLAVGIYEEVAFRGYLLKNMAEGFDTFAGKVGALALATLISSAIFGIAHATNPNATLISSINISLAGILLAMGFLLTGELAIPIGLHITWNFFQGNVFGWPVSGTDAGATLIDVQQGGPELITGGAFGPEAGLIGIAAMLLGIALTVGYVKLRTGDASLHTALAEPELIEAAAAH